MINETINSANETSIETSEDFQPTDFDVDNVLQRAKAEGLKVSADGKISLPGNLKQSPAKSKTPKTPKAPKAPATKTPAEPKEYKGIKSKVFSAGNTIDNIIAGLTAINNTIKRENITSAYKITTYKTELRIVFDTIKGAEFMGKLTQEDLDTMTSVGFTNPDRKDFLSMNIA